MEIIPLLVHKKKYQSPQLTVCQCEMSNSLLVASNEGLGFEDLFTTNEIPTNEVPIIPLP